MLPVILMIGMGLLVVSLTTILYPIYMFIFISVEEGDRKGRPYIFIINPLLIL
jgi:hypothetical protein